MGVGGFIGHFPHHWHSDDIIIEVTELAAITSGMFLLRRKNWARWLAVAWMALHVAISADFELANPPKPATVAVVHQ